MAVNYNAKPLLTVEGLKQYFKVSSSFTVHAVENVSFEIYPGETYGLVGESGSGKSTIGRSIIRLYEPTAGKIVFNDVDISGKLNKSTSQMLRTQMQMIFQDPYSSLNGRMTVKQFFAYPHELDGGRRQRIGIARALILNPEFIVCDEPVSALDVSIQAQILNLLMDLQEEHNLTYLFITHDLSVVKHISDEIMVMYLGKCVEKASAQELFANPLHPYTKALLAAIPIPSVESCHKRRELLQGEVTSPVNPKPGCRFAARCPKACEKCHEESMELQEVSKGHWVACPYV